MIVQEDDDDDDVDQSIPSHLTEFGASAIASNTQRTIHERDVEDEESHHHPSIDNDIDDDEEEMAAAVASISNIRLLSSAAGTIT